MDFIIREMKEKEYALLSDFLYEAIYIPEGVKAPPKSILDNAQLQIYVERFGEKSDDHALVAEAEGKVVGAVWVRIMNDYGHIDDETPSFYLYRETSSLPLYTFPNSLISLLLGNLLSFTVLMYSSTVSIFNSFFRASTGFSSGNKVFTVYWFVYFSFLRSSTHLRT